MMGGLLTVLPWMEQIKGERISCGERRGEENEISSACSSGALVSGSDNKPCRCYFTDCALLSLNHHSASSLFSAQFLHSKH